MRTPADEIQLLGIDADAGAAGNQNFTFRGTQGFTAPGQVFSGQKRALISSTIADECQQVGLPTDKSISAGGSSDCKPGDRDRVPGGDEKRGIVRALGGVKGGRDATC